MRERINRLANENIEQELPQLVVTPEIVDEKVRAGEIIGNDIYITSKNCVNIKGLVYSTNPRVRVKKSAFGGFRNHVGYEINTNFLDHGDLIEGSIYIVTNGGEIEVPYLFTVETGTVGKQLASLKSSRDFADMVRKDYDTALRLFEYKDFADTPFMQDLHVRALYDGLKGRPNRKNQLEEFLVALNAKDAVSLNVNEHIYQFENVTKKETGHIEIRKNTWGYLLADVTTEGDFLEIANKKITDSDFDKDEYRMEFTVDPDKLHAGKNFGSIRISTIRESFRIPVLAFGNEPKTKKYFDAMEYKRNLSQYVDLRVNYECGVYERTMLLNQMLMHIELLLENTENKTLFKLLKAEICFKLDKKDQCQEILDEMKSTILAEKKEHYLNYYIYQHLCLQLKPSERQRESLIRLIHKKLTERPDEFYLYFILFHIDTAIYENPAYLLKELRKLYRMGCHSPFLYLEVCKALNMDAELLRSVDLMEIQALFFGLKKELLSDEIIKKTAAAALNSRFYKKLFLKLLLRMYEKDASKEMLAAVCSMMIKGNHKDENAFFWYEKALDQGINLTKLYDYFLYALPKNYDHCIPREVVLYFSYDKNLDIKSREVLYANILKYMNQEDKLYKDYEREIEQFTMEQLFATRINSNLTTLYEHMIYKDIIDEPVARVLPSILKSYKVHCDNKKMKYVIVCHEELMEEEAYLLEDGNAYVPLFSKRSVLLFQDAYGNRYENISKIKLPVLDKPELEKRCYEIYPSHSMMLLSECAEVMTDKTPDRKIVKILNRSLYELNLHPLYQKHILNKIIQYYKNQAEIEETVSEEEFEPMDITCLLKLDKKGLTKEERKDICEVFIRLNYIKEAYEIIRNYGIEDLDISLYYKICNRMILDHMFGQNELLLWMSYHVFESGKADSIIMDYLCEYYNGTTDQMYRVLKNGIKERVETYDLEERLAAQMIFSDTTAKLDEVFGFYIKRKKTSDNIIKAYFTIKSHEYFVKDQTISDQVFLYLESALGSAEDLENIPRIYLLALTRYYASLPELTDSQAELCRRIIKVLLELGMVFPYFQKLTGVVKLPDKIMDKGMIEYRTAKDRKVELMIRILPDEEDFHEEKMKKVYNGVFVMQKTLFEGEIMEYKIYEWIDGEKVLKKEDSILAEISSADLKSIRYKDLNEMGLCLSLNDEEGLRKKMKEYQKKNAAMKELFPLV